MKTRISVRTGLLVFVLFALAVTTLVAQTQEPEIAIVHVNVIDVIAGTAKPDMTVVIKGNRISVVASASSVEPRANAQIVDGKGQFLIPGLWDMHVHLGNAGPSVLPLLVSYGITGVRDMGSPSFDTIHQWGVEDLAGRRIGPRIIAPGPMLTMIDPLFWQWQVHNPEEARRTVDHLAEMGVDFVKITQTFDRPTYFAIADESLKVGLPLVGHLPVSDDGIGFKVGGVEASNAGQKCFEHLHGIPFPFEKPDPLLIPTLLRNGTWVDPTLVTYWTNAHLDDLIPVAKADPRLKYVPPALVHGQWDPAVGQKRNSDLALKIFQWRMAQAKMLNDNHVPLLAGTDMGFPYVYPGELAKEIELFVEAGLPPADALRTATINPARFLDRDKVLGSVESGKFADLVLLDGNPLDDIHNIERIQSVILNGRYLIREELVKTLSTFQ
jgi:hypothetical protein